MILYIKNMVCNRCIMVVRSELEKLELHPASVVLGEVEIKETLSDEALEGISTTLRNLGFELISEKKSRLIEEVKRLIIELVHHKQNELKVNLSNHIAEQLHHDYNYISNLFSEIEGTTIEKYFIAQKIEKVKELLVYDELSLSEIAFQLNYSSVAYLSNQFKKVTGLSPSHFKNIKGEKRRSLDKI
jgi:YesN/AraC family two-component response regulator